MKNQSPENNSFLSFYYWIIWIGDDDGIGSFNVFPVSGLEFHDSRRLLY